MMDKNFNPAAIEARISHAWEEAGAFRAGRAERRDATPYTIVIPPPNVTGSLHIGHALNNTLQDVLCRFERMRGRDVLWQPGTDHAGIATQMVVERQMRDRQEPGRHAIGRAAFLEKVWAWKAESGGTIVNQLKRLGASCDWSRERFTMGAREDGESGQMQRAVAEFFVSLHGAGLVYKDKRLVNWDPQLLTAISDLEVEQVEIKGHLWHFDYPLEGAVYDPEDEKTFITVATTRPETMLGDTGIAVNPEHERLKDLIGRNAVLPLVGRLIPVIGDDYADPEKGTGAVKITPAHDFNDFEVGRRHRLPVINIMTRDGAITLVGNEAFSAGIAPVAGLVDTLDGQDRLVARQRVVAMMEQAGLLRRVEPHPHMVPHGDRSGVPIEPFLTEQWYVDVKPLAEQAMAAVRSGETTILPANREADFFRWMENIQPWCVSRQLWWGHQIPAWYGPDGGAIIAVSEAAAQAIAEARWGEGVAIFRDEDVLDTWFSSALWPFSTLGWPDETAELERYYPTDTLVTAADILFFWVARMMMAGLFTQGRTPFHTVYLHGLVRDERGRKMSKSVGNVVDPLVIIDQFGADALRFTLAMLAAQGRDPKLGVKTAEGYRNFCTKLWNASRFAEMNGCERVAGFDPAAVSLTLNRWIVGELSRTAREVTEAIEAYRFNDAAAALYRFVWADFCDWHVELAKPVLQGPDGPEKAETRAATSWVLDETLKILHPFMPFITEELWAIKGEAGPARETLLALAPWPAATALDAPDAEAEIGALVDLIGELRSARAEMGVLPGLQLPLVIIGASPEARARLERSRDSLARLGRVSDLSFAETAPAQSVQIVVRGMTAAMPLAGVVDISAEKTRLGKEIARLEGEVKRFDGKLGNADFISRAPDDVVEEQREKRAEAAARSLKLGEALARLA